VADGTVFTGDTGIGIDNTLVGTTVYRQRIVIGSDATSSGFVNPSSVWPTSGTIGLPVRIVGSSGIVLGSVAPSSNWALSSGTAMIGTVVSATSGIVNLSTTSVVGLTTTATVGLTTTSVVGLSSSIQNYVTNSTTVPVYLGLSTSNIVGIVGLSSAVTLSSGSAYLGVVVSATSGTVNLSTTSVVGLTTTSVVGLTTTSLITLSSGVLTIGTLTTGTVVNVTTGSVVGLTTTSVVGLTTTALVGLSTTANAITSQTTAGAVGSSNVFVGGGIVASTANTNPTMSSGMIQLFQVDRSGVLTVNLEGPRQFIKTASLLTAANTSFQQIIAAPGASLVADITKVQIWSTAGNIVTFVTSSGSTAAAWNFPLSSGSEWLKNYDFPIPLTQSGSNIAWGVYSTVAARIMVQYVVGTS